MVTASHGDELRRELGFSSAFFLVVASMIGSGIFTTSGFIIAEAGSPQAMLLAWVLGGVFALTGALCYGELGAMFPRAGGEYIFLRQSFGKGMAFLSGWVSLIVGFSAPIAAGGIAFATYAFRAVPVYTESAGGLAPVTCLALVVIGVFSLVHYHSLYLGSRVQNVLTIFKAALIIIFVVAGLSIGEGSFDNLSGTALPGRILSGEFAVSLIFISFAYSGWNAATYLGSEVKNPTRVIPLSLLAGTLVVTGIYLLVNITYIYALPASAMTGVIEIGATAAAALFGERAAQFFSAGIALCLLSVVGAMILTGPRVYYAMARDGVFFRKFAQVDSSRRTPGFAILLQAGLAMIIVLTATFDLLLLYIGFTLSLFSMLAVAGMVWLRIKEPSRNRRYKTFGYPVTPAVFLLGNLWIIYVSIRQRPVVAIFGLATIVVGILVYLWFRRSAVTPRADHD